jgi:hypothetical protein
MSPGLSGHGTCVLTTCRKRSLLWSPPGFCAEDGRVLRKKKASMEGDEDGWKGWRGRRR